MLRTESLAPATARPGPPHGAGGAAAVGAPGCAGSWVHSVETGGAADGPGIRYIVFLSGCALRCQYCHNPDTWHKRDGTPTTAAEILADIARYFGFLAHGHGGVTISGGEPLVQPQFTTALLQGCKAMGLHTALDTSGATGNKAPAALLDATDLALLDIKAFSEERYRRLTGAPLAPTLDFARRLAALGKPVWLRYVLVPGLTDDAAEIDRLAAFAAGLGNVERVDVLPFHTMGAYKWEHCDRPYRLAGTLPPTPALVDSVRAIFLRQGLHTP